MKRLSLPLGASLLVAADGSNNRPASSAASAAIDVGHIFAGGGTDGLVLYALILGTFLMFLVAVITTWLLLRSLASKDRVCSAQSEKFADAVKETGEALRALAEAVAAKNATEIAHQAALTAVMARIEGFLARMDPLNGPR